MGVLNDTASTGHIVLYIFVFGISIAICFVLLTLLIYHFKMNRTKKRKIKLKFKILSIAALSSFLITLSLYFIADTFQYDVFWGQTSYAMVSLFWGHSNAITYLLFVQRIYHSLGQTEHNPKKCVYSFFYTCIVLVYLCQVYIVIFLLLLNTDIDAQFALNNINTVNAIEIVIQLTLSSSLIYIFVDKLNQIVVGFAVSNRNNTAVEICNLEFSDSQNVLLRVVTKQALLSTFGAATTCIWLICAGIMDVDWIFYPDSAMQIKYALHFLTGIGLMADCTVNAFVIFLSFGFSDSYYDKMCKSCHVCCLAQCKKNTTKYIINEQHSKQNAQL